MSNPFSFDVFLSHNAKNKARVRRLAERLRAEGTRVWFDDWIIKPGDDIYLVIEQGLQTARVLVLCMSPEALGSGWVGLERSTVLFRDPGNAGRRFIPLLLADCDLPDALRRYKYVDYRKEADASFKELLIACREADEQTASREEAKGDSPALPEEPRPTRHKEKLTRTPAKVEAARELTPTKDRAQPSPPVVLEQILHDGDAKVMFRCIAVSPDGMWAASNSRKTIEIWDIDKGTRRTTLKGDSKDLRCVTITPDGKRILSGGYGDKTTVWDVASESKLIELETGESRVNSIVALPDNNCFLEASRDPLEHYPIKPRHSRMPRSSSCTLAG
jgi:hypothetical protein